LSSRPLLVLALLAACSSFDSAPETTVPPDGGADAPSEAGSLPGDASTAVDGDADVDAALSSSAAYRATVLADTPLAFWRFAEATGSPSHTSEIGTHVLVPAVPAPLSGYAGLFTGSGSALGFTGASGERLASSTVPVLVPGAFAFEAWIFIALAPDSAARTIAARSDGSYSFFLYVYESVVWLETGESQLNVTTQHYVGGPGIAQAKWHHIVAQGTTWAQIEVFVDGVRHTTISTTSVGPLSARDFSLGAGDGTATTLGAGGKIAETALYDHVLGPERVTAHYLAGRAP
jgi:hypothetical protein